jgi:Xaa-Pro aminopeptidase
VALSLGPIPHDYRAMRDAVFEDTQRALEILKPGTPWEEIDRELDQACLRGGFYHEIPQVHGIGLDGVEPPLTTMTRGRVPPSPYGRPKPSLMENEEYRNLIGNHAPLLKDLVVQQGMALALECKAARDDSIFVEFGPQIVIEKEGARILTPLATDVIVL